MLVDVLDEDARRLDELNIDEAVVQLKNTHKALEGVSFAENVEVVFLELLTVYHELSEVPYYFNVEQLVALINLLNVLQALQQRSSRRSRGQGT